MAKNTAGYTISPPASGSGTGFPAINIRAQSLFLNLPFNFLITRGNKKDIRLIPDVFFIGILALSVLHHWY